jgi:3-hydroxybutyryl-CoA dehydratase
MMKSSGIKSYIKPTLTAVERSVTKEQIALYAEASGDKNLIHIDPIFAAGSSFGGIVAHGMLILALISEMMAREFDLNWLSSGKLKVRFKAPVYPGETVHTFGELKGEQPNNHSTVLRYTIGCLNDKNVKVIVGDAWVTVPRHNKVDSN